MSKKHHKQMPRISPDVAMDIIGDDMPDGAYFAMLEDMTGMDAVDAMMSAERSRKQDRPFKCDCCNRHFGTERAVQDHKRDKHGSVRE